MIAEYLCSKGHITYKEFDEKPYQAMNCQFVKAGGGFCMAFATLETVIYGKQEGD